MFLPTVTTPLSYDYYLVRLNDYTLQQLDQMFLYMGDHTAIDSYIELIHGLGTVKTTSLIRDFMTYGYTTLLTMQDRADYYGLDNINLYQSLTTGYTNNTHSNYLLWTQAIDNILYGYSRVKYTQQMLEYLSSHTVLSQDIISDLILLIERMGSDISYNWTTIRDRLPTDLQPIWDSVDTTTDMSYDIIKGYYDILLADKQGEYHTLDDMTDLFVSIYNYDPQEYLTLRSSQVTIHDYIRTVDNDVSVQEFIDTAESIYTSGLKTKTQDTSGNTYTPSEAYNRLKLQAGLGIDIESLMPLYQKYQALFSLDQRKQLVKDYIHGFKLNKTEYAKDPAAYSSRILRKLEEIYSSWLYEPVIDSTQTINIHMLQYASRDFIKLLQHVPEYNNEYQVYMSYKLDNKKPENITDMIYAK